MKECRGARSMTYGVGITALRSEVKRNETQGSDVEAQVTANKVALASHPQALIASPQHPGQPAAMVSAPSGYSALTLANTHPVVTAVFPPPSTWAEIASCGALLPSRR